MPVLRIKHTISCEDRHFRACEVVQSYQIDVPKIYDSAKCTQILSVLMDICQSVAKKKYPLPQGSNHILSGSDNNVGGEVDEHNGQLSIFDNDSQASLKCRDPHACKVYRLCAYGELSDLFSIPSNTSANSSCLSCDNLSTDEENSCLTQLVPSTDSRTLHKETEMIAGKKGGDFESNHDALLGRIVGNQNASPLLDGNCTRGMSEDNERMKKFECKKRSWNDDSGGDDGNNLKKKVELTCPHCKFPLTKCRDKLFGKYAEICGNLQKSVEICGDL